MQHQQIFRAVKNGQNQVLVKHIKDSVNQQKLLQIKDSYGWNLIHWAIQKNNYFMVQQLLKSHCSWFIQQKTGKGIFNGEQSPLILAAKQKNQQIVLLLLKSGAHLQSKQINGKTAWEILLLNFNQPFLFKALQIAERRKGLLKRSLQKFVQGQNLYQNQNFSLAENAFIHANQHFQNLQQLDVCSEKYCRKQKQEIKQYLNKIKVSKITKQINELLCQCQQFNQSQNQQRAKQNLLIANVKLRQLKQLKISTYEEYLIKINSFKTKQVKVQKETNFLQIDLLYLQKEAQAIIRKYRANSKIGLKLIQSICSTYDSKFKHNEQFLIHSKYYKLFKEVLAFQNNQQYINSQTINQTQLKIDYALSVISRFVYPSHENQQLKFTHFSNILLISQIYKIHKKFDDYPAGYLAKAFHVKIDQKQIVVISHCGTVDTQNGDIAADFLLIFDFIHIQLYLAQQFTKKVLNIVSQKNIQCQIIQTGHSLGGVLAQMCALQNNLNAVTFQCPGSYDLFIRSSTRHSGKSKIKGYLTAPNFINTLKPHIGKYYRLYPQQQIKIKQNKNEVIQVPKIIQTKNMFTDFLQKVNKVYVQKTADLPSLNFRNLIISLTPQGIINFKKRIQKLSEPLLKILQRDILLHNIDSIVDLFQKAVINSCSGKGIILKRKQIEQWPIGPLQYFSFMTLMIEQQCYEPDQLCKSPAFKYLSKKRNIYYKISEKEQIKQKQLTRPKL